MQRLPVIVGFGGISPAGRVSFNHAYRRMVIDALPTSAADETYESLHNLMGLEGSSEDQHNRDRILNHTLVRKIELFDADALEVNKQAVTAAAPGSKLSFSVSKRHLPDTPPDNWSISPGADGMINVEVDGDTQMYFPDTKPSRVTSAGQLPTGFDPSSTYPSRNHPRGLQITVVAASDAIRSVGIPWEEIRDRIEPDQVAVFSGSCMGQLDEYGLGGMIRAPYLGKRPTSKQAALGLCEMPADFINAYVLGSLGSTGGMIGACATFLYNVKQGIEEIKHGGKRIAIVGGTEAPVTPEIVEGYRMMGALAEDQALMNLDKSETPDNRRACRPFSDNAGFTLAEAGIYLVLMDDELAVELGCNVHGAIPDVFVNADGFKQSIPSPGVGNYLTVGKALALARAIVGEKSVQRRSCIFAHGTGTPQNRVTESQILNQAAQVFGIEKWPLAAVKAYVGHTLAAAAGDQVTSALGMWRHGWLPGISTIDHVADDVEASNLHIDSEHLEIGQDTMDVALVNSKGFGGNNASAVLLSPNLTSLMLAKRYGKDAIAASARRNEAVQTAAEDYDQECTRTPFPSIYRYGENVLEGEDLDVSDDAIGVRGYRQSVSLRFENPYLDMDPESSD